MANEEPRSLLGSGTTSDVITEEEQKKIRAWFAEKAASTARCPVCGTNNWAVLDHFVTPLTLSGADRNSTFFGFSYPHFMLACQNCGNIQFINAYKAGVLTKPDGPPKPQREGT